jgi:tRNA(Ile)-lysidine synthase
VVNFYVNENIKKNTFFSTKDNRLIINEDFFQQPHEVIFRSLSEAIRLISKKYYSVRGKKLENIIEKIENNNCFKQTLSGCIIEKVEQTVIISKEY